MQFYLKVDGELQNNYKTFEGFGLNSSTKLNILPIKSVFFLVFNINLFSKVVNKNTTCLF